MLSKITLTLSLLFVPVHSFAPVAREKCWNRLEAKKDSDDPSPKPSLSVGAFVEFEEKQRRVHIGKIAEVEHKSNGGTRYSVESSDGQRLGSRKRDVSSVH